MDSTSNSLPAAISTSLPPQVGQRNAGASIAHSAAHGVAAQARLDDLLLEPRALADRAAGDELEVELERLGDDLAQAPDAQRDDASTRRPAACLAAVATIALLSDSSCTAQPAGS